MSLHRSGVAGGEETKTLRNAEEIVKVLAVFQNPECRQNLEWEVGNNGEISFFVRVSDASDDSRSDVEHITSENLPSLESTLADFIRVFLRYKEEVKTYLKWSDAITLWVAKQRGVYPTHVPVLMDHLYEEVAHKHIRQLKDLTVLRSPWTKQSSAGPFYSEFDRPPNLIGEVYIANYGGAHYALYEVQYQAYAGGTDNLVQKTIPAIRIVDARGRFRSELLTPPMPVDELKELLNMVREQDESNLSTAETIRKRTRLYLRPTFKQLVQSTTSFLMDMGYSDVQLEVREGGEWAVWGAGPGWQPATLEEHMTSYPQDARIVVASALSHMSIATTWVDGFEWVQRFTKGVPNGPPKNAGPTERSGLRFHFKPDFSLILIDCEV